MTHPVNTDEFHKQLTAYWSGAVDNHETRNRVADWLRERTESRSAPKVDAMTHPVDNREFRQLLAGYLYAALASEPQAAEVLCDWLRTRTDPKPEGTPMDDAEILRRAIDEGEYFPGSSFRVMVDEVKRLRALLPATPDPEPQSCPVCNQSQTEIIVVNHAVWVACQRGLCRLVGPVRNTKGEAVAAWNRIRVEQEGER